MASFWRYVSFSVREPAEELESRTVIPWSVDDLARRHWYCAVESKVDPLDLTAADWQWLREQEQPLWDQLRTQQRHHPQVDFVYSGLFAGQSGDRLRLLLGNKSLNQRLGTLARQAGFSTKSSRDIWWEAVFDDLQAASRSVNSQVSLPRVGKLSGKKVILPYTADGHVTWSELSPHWRRVVSRLSERATEEAAIRLAQRNWSSYRSWLSPDREVVVACKSLEEWVAGWKEFQGLLRPATGRLSRARAAAWRATLEFYYHELSRGLSEAELLLLGVEPDRRYEAQQEIARLRGERADLSIGQLQRDITNLTGRYARMTERWHRRLVRPRWRRLSSHHISTEHVLQLANAWGRAIVGLGWERWSVEIDESADSWQVEPHRRALVVPAEPKMWLLSDLLPILAHEMTHVWQTIQGEQMDIESLRAWSLSDGSTQPLAEAGAMSVERMVRHYLGGPDQTRQYYRRGLLARQRGSVFGVVMAEVARGLVEQSGNNWRHVPIEERREILRQAWRRSLRLYRPTLPLRASRRLLNYDQMKYIESALLADELERAGLQPLLSINSVDLLRWPLYRRLGFDVSRIEPFPKARLQAIIDETVNSLL